MNFVLRAIPAAVWFGLCCVAGMADVLLRGPDGSNGHRFARGMSWGVLPLLGIRPVVRGREHLTAAQPCVYVANHQSYLDVLVYGCLYPPRTVLVAKRQILGIPLFGVMYRAMGNLLIDRDRPEAAIRQMQEAAGVILERGLSVWVFPEGKRKGDGGMLPFKKGAFHLALAAGVPVVPIVMDRLDRRVAVRRLHLRGGDLELRVLEPVATAGYEPEGVDDLVAEVRRRMEDAQAEMARALA